MRKLLFLDQELSLVLCRCFRSELDIGNVLLKVKGHPITGHECPEGE
jgi:hypothetical protein